MTGTDGPAIIAIGGGKGGVGRSTVSVAVARALVKRAHRVLLVDADTASPMLFARLGLGPSHPPEGPGISDPSASLATWIAPTHYPDLQLLTLAFARRFAFVRPKLEAYEFVERLRALPFESVVIDLPAGCDPVFTAMFALSDQQVVVVEPELGAIVAATQYLRAALFQALGFHPDCYDAEEELLLLMRELPVHFDRPDVFPSYLSTVGERVVFETLSQLVPSLVVSRVPQAMNAREVTALADTLNLGWHHLLGIFPRFVGALYARETGDGGVRRDAGLSPLDPDVDRIAGRLVDESFAHQHPRPVEETHTLTGMFGLASDHSFDDVTLRLTAFKNALTSPSSPLHHLVSRQQLGEILDNVERALADSGVLVATASTDPVEVEENVVAAPGSPLVDDEPGDLQEEVVEESAVVGPYGPPREEDDGDDSPGRFLRNLRRDHGISLRELSLRTKIGLKYLEAIEGVDREILPRPVYLRGYLREIAQVFDIDEGRLIDRYFGYLGYP